MYSITMSERIVLLNGQDGELVKLVKWEYYESNEDISGSLRITLVVISSGIRPVSAA